MQALCLRRIGYELTKKTLSVQRRLLQSKEEYEHISNDIITNMAHEKPDESHLYSLQKKLNDVHIYKQFYDEHQLIIKSLIENHKLLKDKELSSLAEEEITNLNASLLELEEKVTDQLLEGMIIKGDVCTLEIMQAMGGAESSLFANDILHMYEQYALNAGWIWKVQKINKDTSIGKGIKNALVNISGHNSYSKFKFENGVHKYMHNVGYSECQPLRKEGECIQALASSSFYPKKSSNMRWI